MSNTLRREDLQDRDMPTQNIPYHKLVELVVRGKAHAIPGFLQGALKAIALSDWERYGDCTLPLVFPAGKRSNLPSFLYDFADLLSKQPRLYVCPLTYSSP